MHWFKWFAKDLIGIHADGLRAAAGLRWFFLAVVLWEFAQHILEVRIGFFESREMARAVESDPTRMVLGWIKMALVYLGGFLVIRYLVNERSERTVAPWTKALPRYLPYLAYSLFVFAMIFYAKQIVPQDHVTTLRTVVGLTHVALEPALMMWIVAAASDGQIRGPLASIRQTGLLYLYALPLFFIARIPVNAAHQLLNRSARGEPPEILWPMLLIDAVVVGLIVAVIPAISVRVARRIHSVRTDRR